ncbi:MAG: hypothetical protein H6607_02560 [Flavobacteriales bacterium]|nr:hypothetical protein [Flavobacteriales bacterium]
MKKVFSKVLKFGLRLFLAVVLLLFILSALISVPSIQTKVVQRLTKTLSKKLNTEVSIGYANISWNGKFKLEDLLIDDQHGDSLIFIEHFDFRILSIKRFAKKVSLGGVKMQKVLVDFHRKNGDSSLNYTFLTQLGKGGGGGGVWMIDLKSVEIEQGEFRYYIAGYEPPTDRTFDENDFAFRQINGSFKDFQIIGDSLNFKIKNLSTVEKNGLPVSRLVSKTIIHRNGMQFSELLLRTNQSSIEDYLAFDYSGFSDFSHFIDSVYIRTNLVNTIVSASDLEYFSKNLTPYKHNVLAVSGNAKGYVSNFKFEDFNIKVGNQSVLAGDVDIKGLPNWRSSFVKLKLSSLASNPQDIERVMSLKLADNLKKFGNIQFSGHLTGFYTDFAADGDLYSELGHLTSRINFKLLQDKNARYLGNLTAENFALGDFLGNNQLGKTSFNIDLVEGSGLTLANMKTKLDGQISNIQLNGIEIKNITANGLYTDQKFDGIAEFKDPNVDLTFKGKIDFKQQKPVFDFESEIRNFDLQKLKIDTADTRISGNINISMKGKTINDMEGTVQIGQFKASRNNRVLKFDSIFISNFFEADQRQLKLKSDMLNANMNGQFELSNFNQIYAEFLANMFPDFYEKPNVTSPTVIDADIEVFPNSLISYWTPYNILLGKGKFKASYNSSEKTLKTTGFFDSMSYNHYTFKKYDFTLIKVPDQWLGLNSYAKEVSSNGKTLTNYIMLNANVLPTFAEFALDIADTTDLIAFRSYGSVDFKSDTLRLALEESKFYLDNRVWVLPVNNKGYYYNDKLYISNFEAQNGNQAIKISGIASNDKNDKLTIYTQNLHLDEFNPLFKSSGYTIGGVSNDSVGILRALGNPIIQGNLKITNLAVNNDTIGDFKITTSSNQDPLLMNINAEIANGLLKDVTLKGTLDLRNEIDVLNFQLWAKESSIKPAEPWFKGVASDFRGTVSTSEMRITGNLKEPKFWGTVTARGVGIKVDYLNTNYHVNDFFEISNDKISFKNVDVVDDFGNKAFLNGTIYHNLFDKFSFDLTVDRANNLQVLNTDKTSGEVFYGKAFATGSATFKGPLENMVIDIKGKSNNGTKLVIPIYYTSENQMVDYIKFKKPPTNDSTETIVTKAPNDQILKMNFNLDVTDDAEFVLLFDEVLDDKITGRGNGNINMTYNSATEDFYMFGTYVISSGSYPFSSPTLASEKFDLREGGQIVWNGDPYNAKINLQAAVARNTAKPIDLMLGLVEDEERYNNTIKMNVILNLKGELFNPDITFGWEFPDASQFGGLGEFNSMVKKVEADPDEMNRQVFSLLTFGSFIPASNFGIDVGNSNGYRDIVNSSIGNFLSNQLNNWISEYAKNLELDVNYITPSSGISDQQKAELILSIRQKILNERLEFSGTYNNNPNAATNSYNFDLVFKVKKDGTLKLKTFYKRANDPNLGQISNVTTSGLGLYFRKQFDAIRLRKTKVE